MMLPFLIKLFDAVEKWGANKRTPTKSAEEMEKKNNPNSNYF